MNRFASLRDLLMTNLFETVSHKHGHTFVRLKETGVDAKLKQIDIYDIHQDSIVLKLDQVDQPSTLFKGEKGERQRCDYVLVTIYNNNPFVVFIEIKSKVAKNAEITRQFKGAECLMDYCNSALNRFHDQHNVMLACEKRFVVFYKPSIAKRRTRPVNPCPANKSPESPLKYPAPHNPSLNALVCL